MNRNDEQQNEQLNEGQDKLDTNERYGHNHHPSSSHHEPRKIPWYNKGWIWMLIVLLSIGVILFGFSWIADEIRNVSEGIGEQTEVIEERNQIIEEGNQLLEQIRVGIDSIVIAIREAVYDIMDRINQA